MLTPFGAADIQIAIEPGKELILVGEEEVPLQQLTQGQDFRFQFGQGFIAGTVQVQAREGHVGDSAGKQEVDGVVAVISCVQGLVFVDAVHRFDASLKYIDGAAGLQ